MLCCLLAGLLALAGANGRRQGAGVSGRLVGFGACCGVLAFEVVATLAAGLGGLRTNRPELLLVAASLATGAGMVLARTGGAPRGRRGWALFALSASGASALAELADLHLLALHRAPDLLATIALHGLALIPGMVAGRLLLQQGRQDEARLPTRSIRGSVLTTAVLRRNASAEPLDSVGLRQE